MNDDYVIVKFAENVRIKRLERRLSQMQLAEKIDVSLNHINLIERKKTNPSVVTLYKLCKALETDANTLLGF